MQTTLNPLYPINHNRTFHRIVTSKKKKRTHMHQTPYHICKTFRSLKVVHLIYILSIIIHPKLVDRSLSFSRDNQCLFLLINQLIALACGNLLFSSLYYTCYSSFFFFFLLWCILLLYIYKVDLTKCVTRRCKHQMQYLYIKHLRSI